MIVSGVSPCPRCFELVDDVSSHMITPKCLMNQNNNLKKDIELLTGKYEEMKTRADKADVEIKRLREALEKVNSMLDMLDLDWELGAYVDDIQTLIRDELNKE